MDNENPENDESPSMRIISPERNPFKNRSPSPRKRDCDENQQVHAPLANSMTGFNLISIPEEEKEESGGKKEEVHNPY
jgi:hypothetical protein